MVIRRVLIMMMMVIMIKSHPEGAEQKRINKKQKQKLLMLVVMIKRKDFGKIWRDIYSKSTVTNYTLSITVDESLCSCCIKCSLPHCPLRDCTCYNTGVRGPTAQGLEKRLHVLSHCTEKFNGCNVSLLCHYLDKV